MNLTGKPLVTVYALVDPRDMAVKYVGVSNDLERRLRDHLDEARGNFKALRNAAGVKEILLGNYVKAARARWLMELISTGLEPLVITLAILPEPEAQLAEKDFIHAFAAHTPLYQTKDTGIKWRAIREIDAELDRKEARV